MKGLLLVAALAGGLACTSTPGQPGSDDDDVALDAALQACMAVKALYHFRGFDNDAGTNACSHAELGLYVSPPDPASLMAQAPTAAGVPQAPGSGRQAVAALRAACAAVKARYRNLGFEGDDDPGTSGQANACSDLEMSLFLHEF